MLKRLLLLYVLAGSAAAADLTPLSCPQQTYSPEALRYEMEGTARLTLTLDEYGDVLTARVRDGSEFHLLDQASLVHARACHFPRNLQKGEHEMTVAWRLPVAHPDVRPRLLPATCRNLFKVLTPDHAVPPADTITVRTMVWTDGQPYTPRTERSSGNATLDAVAEYYVETCRFEPALRDGKPVRGAQLVALPFDRAVYAEPVLRQMYDRLVARLPDRHDYRVAQIFYTSEADAHAAIAKIQRGESFAGVALQESFDASSRKKGGDLGWKSPGDLVDQVEAALRARDARGLLPEPVHTPAGWHVLSITDIRPATAPTYESVRGRLETLAIAERRGAAQREPATQAP